MPPTVLDATRRTFRLGLLAPLALLLGCSLALDNDPVQCRSDADCSRFGGLSCDQTTGVCTQSLQSGGGSASTAGSGSGGAPVTSQCSMPDKPLVEISGDI